MHIVIYDKVYPQQMLLNENLSELDISSVLDSPAKGSLKDISEKDYHPNVVCNLIEEQEGHIKKTIIIVMGGRCTWLFAQRLACHIRFHPFAEKTNELPVIISYNEKPDLLLNKNLMGAGDIQNFQYEAGFYFKSNSEIWSKTKNEFGEECLYLDKFYNEELKNKTFPPRNTSLLEINSKEMGGRHSVANQWGALKLAINASLSLKDIQYKHPQTLYFKYLLQIHGLPSTENEIPIRTDLLKGKTILLIDDNAQNGWHEVLEKVLHCDIVSIPSVIEISDIIPRYKEFALVFLDLYLPNPLKTGYTDMVYSIKVLKELKEKYPEVPIIAFTASNKSTTMEKVIELGADGMYIKESPEFVNDRTYSNANYKNFVFSVNQALEKYSVLRPFWSGVETIKNSPFFKELKQNDDSGIFNRIIERLEMFYGLLKKGTEQSSYDKKMFHFSDYELAYITLWSAFNEISEAFYVKSQPKIAVTDKNGKTYNEHPDKTPLAYYNDPIKNVKHHKWTIRNTNDVFLEYSYTFKDNKNGNYPPTNQSGKYYLFDFQQKSKIYLDKKIGKVAFYKQSRLFENRINYENTLFLQIAFLLDKLHNYEDRYKSINQKNLLELNDLRNKLYLTHGVNEPHFYAQTEQEKREANKYNVRPNKEIKKLFELIGFILTGEQVSIKFDLY